MTVLDAIILGIIQGLTEFIPISSTAHLTIAGELMGLIDPNNPEQWTAFIATIQLGTMAAVLVYFAREIKSIPVAFLKENLSKSRQPIVRQSNESRMGWMILLGTIPVVVIGLAFKDVIEGSLTKDLRVIAFSLIALAILMAVAEKSARFKKDFSTITIRDAIIIGFAQCLALIPGSSRSGTTITAGLFLGINRSDAARFSFLLSIPAVLGSGLFEFYQTVGSINSQQLLNLAVATISSAVSGYLAISFLINYLRKRSTLLFIVYRIIIGLIILFFIVNLV